MMQEDNMKFNNIGKTLNLQKCLFKKTSPQQAADTSYQPPL
jgi:hypothetical protein